MWHSSHILETAFYELSKSMLLLKLSYRTIGHILYQISVKQRMKECVASVSYFYFFKRKIRRILGNCCKNMSSRCYSPNRLQLHYRFTYTRPQCLYSPKRLGKNERMWENLRVCWTWYTIVITLVLDIQFYRNLLSPFHIRFSLLVTYPGIETCI